MPGQFKILVVEDSSVQATLLKRVLEKEGYLVEVAKDGALGLKACLATPPNLVISDITMPEMDGFELCAAIKEQPRLRQIPVILLTNLSDPSDILKGLKAKADHYLTKPFDNGFLLSKVQQLLKDYVPPNPCAADQRVEVTLGGEKAVVETNLQQALPLLLSTYENSIQQNRELIQAQLELKRVNAQLEQRTLEYKASEQRLSILMQTAPDIIYSIDSNGHFTYINSAINRLGFDGAELIGKHFSTIISPMDVEAISYNRVMSEFSGKVTGEVSSPKLFDERRSGQRKTTGLEVRLMTKSAEERRGLLSIVPEQELIVEISSAGLHDEDQAANLRRYLGTVGVIRDISDRKKVERELQEAQEQLQKRVKEELYNELKASYSKLKETTQMLIQAEKLSAVGTIAAGIAHELNNPLMGILNFVRFCLRVTEPEDQRYPVLEDCLKETKSSILIVQNLLTFSHMEPVEELEYKEEDLGSIFDRILRLLSYRITKLDVNVQLKAPKETPKVWSNLFRLQQVFLNLLSNSLDALEEATTRRITIEIIDAHPLVKIIVKDTGVGMAPQVIERVFDPFFTTKPPGKGTGLGLSICRTIITEHGGQIECSSQLGLGTSFTTTLRKRERS